MSGALPDGDTRKRPGSLLERAATVKETKERQQQESREAKKWVAVKEEVTQNEQQNKESKKQQ
jgi:hypothetical protein